ncbi:MAG: hypothetical protein E6J90_08630 [Deltaproteobacteria bacterium]|nr:MAG: hypothetical protein E6J91_34290 [Deltaproteobacteria bacterium]TMQ24198.1 MAG: hypothetical protein E6J90_08630 [Deltaproteobacteria bacterium]
MTRAAAALAAVLVSLAAPALADPQAEAVVLFDQGIKDLKAGRIEKACTELAASLQLVKDSGTKGALARCHGRAGRVASAWLLWRELADTAPSAELRSDAAAQAARLERRLPKYTIKLAGPTPGLVVQVNGREVAVDVPVAVPIDPGPVTASAAGRDGERVTTRSWSHDYTAVEGQTLAIEIPVLEPLAAAPVEPPRPRPPRPADADRDAERDAQIAASRHRRHILAGVIGGLALGAAGAGTVLGLDARGKFNDAKQRCGGSIDQCATDQVTAAKDRVDAARRSARWSDYLFGGAGAAAITAVIVWATAPSLETKPVALVPSLGDGSIGLVVRGAF